MEQSTFNTPLSQRVCELLKITNFRQLKPSDIFIFEEKQLAEGVFSGEMYFFAGLSHEHLYSEEEAASPKDDTREDEKIIFYLTNNHRIMLTRKDGRLICSFEKFTDAGKEKLFGTIRFGEDRVQLCNSKGKLL